MNHEHGCRLVSATFGIKSLTFNRNKRSVATAKSWRGRFAMHDSTGVWPPTLGTADVHATRLRFQVLHLLDSHHALYQRAIVCINIAPGDEAHWQISTGNPKIGGGGAAPPKPFTPFIGILPKVSKTPPFPRVVTLIVVVHDPHLSNHTHKTLPEIMDGRCRAAFMALTATIHYPSRIVIPLILLLASKGVQIGAFPLSPSLYPHASPSHAPHIHHLLLFCLRSFLIYDT